MLSVTMNPTHAQRLVSAHLFEQFDRQRVVQYLPVAVGVFYVASGLLRFVSSPRVVSLSIARRRWQWLVRGPLILIGLWLLRQEFMSIVSFEHSGFQDRQMVLYGRLLIIAAMAGWVWHGLEMDWKALACAGAAFGFVTLRADLWDYYLLDVALFGIASVPVAIVPGASPTSDVGRSWKAIVVSSVALAVLLSLLLFHWRGAGRIKLEIDRQVARVQLAERSLRAGTLQVSEIGFTNVGFMGWHLHPYFVSHDARTDQRQIGFVGYLGGARAIRSEISPRLKMSDKFSGPASPSPRDPSLLDTGLFSDEWVFQRQHSLRAVPAVPPSTPVAINFAEYVPRRFPLNTEEWRQLIAKRLK